VFLQVALSTRPHPQPQALRAGVKNSLVIALPFGVQEQRIDAQAHAFFGGRDTYAQPLATPLVHDSVHEIEEGCLATWGQSASGTFPSQALGAGQGRVAHRVDSDPACSLAEPQLHMAATEVAAQAQVAIEPGCQRGTDSAGGDDATQTLRAGATSVNPEVPAALARNVQGAVIQNGGQAGRLKGESSNPVHCRAHSAVHPEQMDGQAQPMESETQECPSATPE
jgi:hypothetical protein